MILLGLLAATEGRHYAIGTLRQMGPGYFPIALGVILIGLGILIAATAAGSTTEADDVVLPPQLEWRGWLCIIGGPVLFMIFGEFGGLIPATFACVLVSALGDRTTTLRQALILSAAVTVFGVVLFSYLLKIPMPIWKWGYPL